MASLHLATSREARYHRSRKSKAYVNLLYEIISVVVLEIVQYCPRYYNYSRPDIITMVGWELKINYLSITIIVLVKNVSSPRQSCKLE